ncbi:CDP-glycerol glycerophosphotransferase family protein [Aeromicrobium duanguangcaii]|uniref:CDP-glycerol glycerophosphotransferase family protein n=1 Tax=Aeromicrobium duanguangcaii TaxID=2968086 RepID=UPI002016F842|nr:CDP-glycerol glycerophosphotransferase family protein [Aeromicrobium duanguangcaii]MCL3838505.1 CDP-glycerol glycerophosphotransferase family protein [Aeromicrobium duanguangcaii]
MGKLRSLTRRVRDLATGPAKPLDVLAREFPPLVRKLPKDLDGSVEAQLRERLPDWLREVDRAALVRRIPSWAKVALHHLENDDPDALHAALDHGLLDVRQFAAGLHEGEPVVHLPGWDDPSIPRETFVLATSETRFAGEVVRARVVEDRFEAVIRAGFAHIDADGAVPELIVITPGVRAEWIGETSGHRGGAAMWRETYDRSTWAIELPISRLGPEQALDLEIEVRLAGRTAGGRLDLLVPADPIGPAIDGIDLERDTIVVRGRGLTTAPTLESASVTVKAIEFSRLGSSFRAVFPATADRWGRGPLPLPVGDYAVTADGQSVPLAAELVDWPTDLADGPLVGHTTHDGLRLIKPRLPDENTMYGQRYLREAYEAYEAPVDPRAAMFQCYWAEVATDSQAAIHRELRRRDPRLRLYWGAVDHSVALPEGAKRVIAGTREWYSALATAKYIVKNTEVGAYTRLRPGQVYLQTFHGQPFKRMGRPDFVRRMAPWRAEYEATTRRSAYWDVICLPYPEAAEFYREAYDWDGPAFDHGLPRTDSLLADDAAEVRRRTRRLLGIRDDQTAVLHATTWREDLSRGDNTSADPGLLDVKALAEQLGDDVVVLQRSHHSVARSDQRHGSGGGVVDVTDHPEINDLVLAADLAILDYTSLRFDFAITGKPMIFFVPDLEKYENELRGFLFPFEESAPGPVVRDSGELAALVRDTSWAVEHADAYAAFNERFNRFHDGHAAERVVDGLLGWDT